MRPAGDARLVSDEVADGPRYPKHGRDSAIPSLLSHDPSRWPALDKELWRMARAGHGLEALAIRQLAGDLAARRTKTVMSVSLVDREGLAAGRRDFSRPHYT